MAYGEGRQEARVRDSPRRARSRSRSPYREDRRHHDRRLNRPSENGAREAEPRIHANIPSLPLGARPLRSRDLHQYKPLFSLYLDIQKNVVLDDIDDREVRGRWKSFIKKWNNGELAEGWYDPDTLRKAEESFAEPELPPRAPRLPGGRASSAASKEVGDEEASDDEYGPAPPTAAVKAREQRQGVSIPSLQDLDLQREQAQDEQESEQQYLRQERKDFRRTEKARLDELVPKAEAGTRERQLEKRREAAAANNSFAMAKTDAGGAMEVRDEDLMGGGDSIEEYSSMKKEAERKKNEREIRRDEILRARQAEREERVRAYRDKEDKTMAGLIALAKQRYG